MVPNVLSFREDEDIDCFGEFFIKLLGRFKASGRIFPLVRPEGVIKQKVEGFACLRKSKK